MPRSSTSSPQRLPHLAALAPANESSSISSPIVQSASQSSSISSTYSSAFSAMTANTQRTSVSLIEPQPAAGQSNYASRKDEETTKQELKQEHVEEDAQPPVHKVKRKRNLSIATQGLPPDQSVFPSSSLLSASRPQLEPQPAMSPAQSYADQQLRSTTTQAEPLSRSELPQRTASRVLPSIPGASKDHLQQPPKNAIPLSLQVSAIPIATQRPSPRSPTTSPHAESMVSNESNPVSPVEPTFYPLGSHLLHPELLSALLQWFNFREALPLFSISMSLKKAMEETKDVKEIILEKFLGDSVGYRRWNVERMGKRKEPLSLTLRVRLSFL